MLRVEGLSIHTGERPLVEGLALDLAEGAITCLIGPSGCGKTSVLKWLAGVLPPELIATGTARLDGAPLAAPHAYQPQQDTLFPWLNIAENAGLALEIAGARRATARDLSLIHI